MAQRDDPQLTDKIAPPGVPIDATPPPGEVATCPCDEFRRNQVCDHVLMAAAVRMVRRMIDVHADSDTPR
jgi:hypothetical protein